jgi:hypothetical protein
MASQYQTEQDADTPLARWRFEETSGTTFADDVGGKTVTISGSVTPGSAATGPFPGQGVGADFTGGRVTATGITTWRPQTVEALVYLDSVPSTSNTARIPIYRSDSGATPLVLSWNIDGTSGNQGKLGVGWFTNASVWVQVSASAASVTPGLRHIVGVYNGTTTLTLYVDGAQVATGTVASRGTITGAGDTLNIGARNDGTFPLDGRIYDLAVYNGALSAGRVAAHYTASQQVAGFQLTGGGDWSWPAGTPTVEGIWPAHLTGGGVLHFVSTNVSASSTAPVHFTAHPGDFTGDPGSWVLEDAISSGALLLTTDHSTHVYTPGGDIERVLASVISNRPDPDLVAVITAADPTILTPGQAAGIPWLAQQVDLDVQAGDGAWPGSLRWARNLYIAWQRVNTEATTTADAALWWGNLAVFHKRYNYSGGTVDVTAHPALDVEGLVHDLMGRGFNSVVEYDPNRVPAGMPWGTRIGHASWWDGVSAREVLSFAEKYAPALWWVITEPGPSGLPKFEVGRWDGPIRYVLAPGTAHVELDGGADDLANRCLVRYIGSTMGQAKSTWVAEVRANVRGLADAGMRRTMTLDLTGEGPMSPQDARVRGLSALRVGAQAKTTGKATIGQPVMDLVAGRMVDPWEIQPGWPVVVSDAPVSAARSTSIIESVGADGIRVFRCRSVAFDAGRTEATLSLDGGSRSLIGRLKVDGQARRYDIPSAQV